MHPALSIILFTVLSGIGFGLIALVGLGLGPDAPAMAWAAGALALVLAGGGLSASVFHLRRPDRAWRAFSQWRSSWLSREAVLAVICGLLFGLYELVWIATGTRIALPGLAASVLALATVYATSMIYAQIRAVPKWATWLTPACYIAFGLAGGALALGTILWAVGAQQVRTLQLVALVLLALAWGVKAAWWRRDGSRATAGGDIGAATGLGRLGRVRQFEPPHTGGNYLLSEMGFRVARHRARALRRVAVGLGALVPAALLVLAILAGLPGLCAAAFLSHLVGMLAERWLFFAEARHVVSSYYDLPD